MGADLLLKAYMLGWAVAAPIGPVNVEIARRALRHRPAAGFATGVGATMVDATYVVLAGFGLMPLLQRAGFLRATFLAGGVLLAILGALALRDGWRRVRGPVASLDAGRGDGTEGTLLRSWLVGLAMTATNPMTIAFWATMPAALFAGTPPSTGAVLAAGGAVWLGAFSWIVTVTAILAAGRRVAREKLLTAATLLGGAVMVLYAGRFLWMAAHGAD